MKPADIPTTAPPHSLDSLLACLESIPARLQSSADLSSVLDELYRLPQLLAQLGPDLTISPHTERLRAILWTLQLALQQIEPRLACEHHSLKLELQGLALQQEWISTSRQIL